MDKKKPAITINTRAGSTVRIAQAFYLCVFEKTQLKKNSIFRKNPKLSLRKIQKLNISQVFWLNLLNRAVKKLNQKLKELNFWIHLKLPKVSKVDKKKACLNVTASLCGF